MSYKVFDCNVNDFTGEIIEEHEVRDKLIEFESEYKECILLPEISYKENGLTFEEWIKAIVDAEHDIKHGCKEAERDLYELQEEYPEFFGVWSEALFQTVNHEFYNDLLEV